MGIPLAGAVKKLSVISLQSSVFSLQFSVFSLYPLPFALAPYSKSVLITHLKDISNSKLREMAHERPRLNMIAEFDPDSRIGMNPVIESPAKIGQISRTRSKRPRIARLNKRLNPEMLLT